MKYLISLATGLFIGLWIAWPGILSPNNWKCFKEIIDKTANDKISLKAILSVSPSYLLKMKKNNDSKIRIVSDACFR